MLELIFKIREHTEAGSILEHMYLFDELQSIKFVGMYCGVNAWALDVDDEILVDEIELLDENKTPGAEAVRELYKMLQKKESKD